jgi:hypothetical protein
MAKVSLFIFLLQQMRICGPNENPLKAKEVHRPLSRSPSKFNPADEGGV